MQPMAPFIGRLTNNLQERINKATATNPEQNSITDDDNTFVAIEQ